MGAVAGGAIAVHGASNVTGGISKIINGLHGSTAGDTGNFEKNAFKAIGGETGEAIYHAVDLGVGLAQPVELIVKAIYKNPDEAIKAYQAGVGLFTAGRVVQSTEKAAVEEMGNSHKDPAAEIRKRVLENIAKSRAAKEASNFDEYLKNEKILLDFIKERQALKGTNKGNNRKFSEMSEDEQIEVAKQYVQKAPIEIPESATMKAKSMTDGYEQISYKWSDGTYKYEVRWHTRTSGAPADQENTWVLQRTLPGSGGQKPQTFFKIGENEWVEGYKWYDAIAARKVGTATPEQIRILDQGHWKE